MNYYSPDAEQAVLGGLLRDNTVWPSIHEQLTFKDFYRREHQVLFDLISKKIQQGECVDALSLSNEVKTIPELKEINGEIYVFELLNQPYSISNIAYHAAIVKSHSQRRKFNELLDYLGKQANEGDVKKLIQQAQIELNHLESEKITREHGILYQRFSEVEQQPIDWLWPGRIARGKVTIIAGNPGLGKSQITASLAAIVTTGDIWPVDKIPCQSGNVIFLSAEDDPSDTLAPRLSAAGADLTKAHFLKCVQIKNGQGKLLQKSFNLKTDIANLDKLLEEIKEVALLIIDPITAYLGATDSYKNAEIRALLTPLSELAAKHNLAVVAISHLNKAVGQDPLMRVSGSLAFVAAARAAFLVAQDPNDDNRRLLLPMKNNIGNDKTGLAFSIESCSLESDIYTSRIVWEEEAVDIKAHEIMKPQDDPEEHTLLKEAMDFLSDQLAHFSKPVSKLKKEANDYGLSWRTTLRAKTALKIITQKSGMNGGWMWSLPKETKVPEEYHIKTLASFGEFGLLRQNLNDFKENNKAIGQSLTKETKEYKKIVSPTEELGLLRQDLNNLEDKNEEIGQNLLKEAKNPEECQTNHMASFGKDDGYLRQNLTNSEKPKEEEVFIIDVSDLMEKKDA